MRFKSVLFIFLVVFFYWFNTRDAKAVSATITDYPSTITSDSFNISVTITGPEPGTNYLRIDLFKEGSTNYFGETFNGSNWYSGSSGNQYFPITIPESKTASATFQGRLGSNISGYDGPGSYKLSIRRYVSTDNSVSTEVIPVSVNISVPVSTPTNSPAPTATSSPTPSPTITPAPTATPTKSPSPTPKKTSPTPTPPSLVSFSSEEPAPPGTGEVLGLGTNMSPSPLVASDSSSGKKFPLVAVLFITGGLTFVGLALFMFFRSYQNQKEENTNV